jgi:hypothetical protein
MTNDDISVLLTSLTKGSRLSVGLTVVGLFFLVTAVVYSATRVSPLEVQASKLKEQVAQLDAKTAELDRLVVTADIASVPAPVTQGDVTGWVYLGRVSAAGAWAPRSDRVKSAEKPSDVTVGAEIQTLKNSSLVNDIDSDTSRSNSPTTADQSNRMFIKPGIQLKILALRNQKSINDGALVWAKVQTTSSVFVNATAK